MEKLKEIVAYILINYPLLLKRELSKSRVTKIVYLCDWKSAIEYGKTITNIQWVFNHYGPYIFDIVNLVQESKDFNIKKTFNMFGTPKEIIEINNQNIEISNLTENEKFILNFVISKTSGESWDSFIKLVYSTYPITTQDRYSNLNLVKLAEQYKKESAYTGQI